MHFKKYTDILAAQGLEVTRYEVSFIYENHKIMANDYYAFRAAITLQEYEDKPVFRFDLEPKQGNKLQRKT